MMVVPAAADPARARVAPAIAAQTKIFMRLAPQSRCPTVSESVPQACAGPHHEIATYSPGRTEPSDREPLGRSMAGGLPALGLQRPPSRMRQRRRPPLDVVQ